ncbi:aminoglycoside phosphotransferase family protein [Streptomyces albus]|uniref:phosphotransferase enzyme family protein n=1 Tax=Streptomyces albus TaxID=1888 RepID=UPI0033F05991
MDEGTGQEALNETNARQAMLAACAAVGLAGERDAALLRLGENALFLLPAAGVVVRVARSAAMAGKVAKELAVARWLAAQDYPGLRPVEVDRQPVEVEGRLATFWEYTPEDGTPPSITVLAQLIRALHQLPDPGFALPVFDPFPVMRSRLANASGVRRDEVRFLAEACDTVEDEFRSLMASAGQHLIHGDAHRGNVLVTGGRPLLIDYETMATGPRAWDLIPTATAVDRFGLSAAEYAAFCDAYGSDVTRDEGYDVLRTTRELGMTTWLMQNVRSEPVAEEFSLRVQSLRKGDRTQRWHAF